jgi:hypothetical protein
MNCDECRNRMSELLYGELDEPTTAGVTKHLEGCAECAARRAELTDTMRALDAWSPVESSSDAPLVAALAMAEAAKKRRGRGLRPWLTGIAAALVLFAGLVAVGADVRVEDGRMLIAFGRGPAITPAPAVDVQLIDRMQREMEDDRQLIVASVEGRLGEWGVAQETRYRELVDAITAARIRDEVRFVEALETVARGAAAGTEQNRERIDGVLRYVVMGQGSPYDAFPRQMEIVP